MTDIIPVGPGIPDQVYLDDLKKGEEHDVSGKYLKIVDSSSATATVDIAIQTNMQGTYYTGLKKNSSIYLSSGFSKYFINSAAQAGEWVKISVSDGPDQFNVDNPGQGTIDGIANPVQVYGVGGAAVAVNDANSEASLSSINTALTSDRGVKRTITPLGANKYGAFNIGTAVQTIVAAASNVNGLILRNVVMSASNLLGLTLSAGSAAPADYNSTTVNGILTIVGNTNAGVVNQEYGRDIFIPAGFGLYVACNNGGFAYNASAIMLTYDLL